MQPRPFLPSARQVQLLLAVGFLTVGYALYLRYLAIEQPTVALACDAGLDTWLCTTRGAATVLFRHSAFGWAAVALALGHLWRPSMPWLLPGLAAAGFGLVLYNGELAALAVALLIAGFARPQSARA